MKRATFLSMALLILPTTGRTAGIYTYEKATTLSAASEKVTLHFPTGSSKTVYLIGATIYSSVATTYTVERDGTAPTSTAAPTSPVICSTAAAQPFPPPASTPRSTRATSARIPTSYR